MTNIKVLGTGCRTARTRSRCSKRSRRKKAWRFSWSKVEDIKDITGYGIMSTPGVVIEGQVVHAGGVPSRSKVEGWLGGV